MRAIQIAILTWSRKSCISLLKPQARTKSPRTDLSPFGIHILRHQITSTLLNISPYY